MITRRKVEKYNEAIDKFTDKSEKLAEEVGAMYATKIKKTFNGIAREATAEWYKDYSPSEYKRHWYSLKRIPHIDVDIKKGTFDIQFDSDRIQGFHRVTRDGRPKSNPKKGKEYLFDIAFLRGWHGGAYSGPPDAKGRKFPGIVGETPYWRTPKELNYPYWGNKAERYTRRNFTPYPSEDLVVNMDIQEKDPSHSLQSEIMDEFNRQKDIIKEDIINYYKRRLTILANEVKKAQEKYLK